LETGREACPDSMSIANAYREAQVGQQIKQPEGCFIVERPAGLETGREACPDSMSIANAYREAQVGQQKRVRVRASTFTLFAHTHTFLYVPIRQDSIADIDFHIKCRLSFCTLLMIK